MLVLAAIGVLLLVAWAALALGGAVAAMHRARAAADLSALAAASAYTRGADLATACAAGESVASANGARQDTCRGAPDGSVTVTTVVGLSSALGTASDLTGPARAEARAGPVSRG